MSPALATVLVVLLAGIIFVLPLLPALIELRLKRDAHPLNVIQQYAGEIRHFSYGFRVYIGDLLEPLEKCVVSGTAMKGAMRTATNIYCSGMPALRFSLPLGKRHRTAVQSWPLALIWFFPTELPSPKKSMPQTN